MTEENNPDEELMDILVIGGIADGLFIRGIPTHVRGIQLRRPEFVKPLTSPTQQQPEIAKETQDYYIYQFGCDTDKEDESITVGFATPMESNMYEAFKALAVRYVHETVSKLMDDNNPYGTDKNDLRNFDA